MKNYYKLPENLDEDIVAHENDVKRFIAGDLASGIFKARRVPRGIYEQRENGTYMMRVRVAGGSLTAEQARKVADLAEKYGDLHVTTRQDVQIHNVKIDESPELMRELKTVGLTSKGGGGNTVRNVAACPFAGVCPSEVFDVAPYSHAVTEYLITLEGSYNLPRKYKIAFSGCAADCALARINDLGFIAKVKDGKPGFVLYGGGGMGAVSRPADLLEQWVPAEDVIKISEAMRRVFDRTGDRHNRSKARLRFVFDRLGVDTVKAEMAIELKSLEDVPLCSIETELNEPESELVPVEKSDGGVQFFNQRQEGYVAMRLRLPLGFISCSDFRMIAEIAGKYSAKGELSTTRAQDLLVRYIPEAKVSDVVSELSGLTSDVLTPGALDSFVACAGASTCRLGLCLARGAANASAEYLDKEGVNTDGLDINISGCPNSCGQHPSAPVGFFGAAMREDKRLVPAYRVVLGARNDVEGARLSESAGMLPARAMPSFLAELASDYGSNSKEGESFSEYYDRCGYEHFSSMVERQAKIPSYEERPDYYRDWGLDDDFSLAGRGAGECGAGVFEVVSNDITAAKKALESGDVSKAFLCSVRALLITRGVDSSDPKDIQSAFEEHFVATGLVKEEYGAAKDGMQSEQVSRLLDRVEVLYSTLDANLKFHPPEGEVEEVDTEGTSDSSAVVEYDLKGVGCPMNFVKAKLKLEMMSEGDVLRVILDDGEPVRNVPASFKAEGQDVLAVNDLGDGHWAVDVKKKVG